VTGRPDKWIKRTTIGCVGMLALIAGTVSHLHMHLLVETHGQPGWVAALTPLSVDGKIVAASPTLTGRVIAAWPSFSLIAAYELLMRQVRRAAEAGISVPRSRRAPGPIASTAVAAPRRRTAMDPTRDRAVAAGHGAVERETLLDAWRWAQDNRADDGSLPTGRAIARRYGRHERWGRLVKRSGLTGELGI
jgi:hypothetical protein